MKLKLVRKDCEDSTVICLAVGKHVLGRGPLLNSNDKRISREHGMLEVFSDGSAKLNAMHINPCFFYSLEDLNSMVILKKGESIVLKNGDEISLLPDSFHYTISFVEITNEEDSQNTEELENNALDGVRMDSGLDTTIGSSGLGSGLEGEPDTRANGSLNTSNDVIPIEERHETVTLSDSEITFDELEGAEQLMERNLSSPSLLDKDSQNVSNAKQANTAEDDKDQSDGPQAKRHRPNTPQDVKPDLANLQKALGEQAGTSSGVKDEASSLKVKDEPEDKKNVKKEIKKEEGDGAKKGSDDDSGNSSGVPKDGGKAAAPRNKCNYGSSCYRQNPQHRLEYSHPGDADWSVILPCPYGAACYRQNPQHRAAYSHPGPPAPRPQPPPGGQQNTKDQKRAKRKATKKKRPSWSGSDSEDEYDMEDPFMADDSSDDFVPSTDDDTGKSSEDEEDTEEIRQTKKESKRLLREAKKFSKQK